MAGFNPVSAIVLLERRCAQFLSGLNFFQQVSLIFALQKKRRANNNNNWEEGRRRDYVKNHDKKTDEGPRELHPFTVLC